MIVSTNVKLGVYVRVSTPAQVEDGYSLQDQRKDGAAFAKEYGFHYRLYDDGGVSGTLSSRAALDELCHDIETEKIQAVWVADEKRFSRSAEIGLHLINTLIKHGTKFFVGNKERDPTDPNTYMMLGIAFLFAQRDHLDIKVRLWKGIRASWNNGDRTGVAPYGYDAYFDVSDKGKRKLKINEAQAKVVKKVFQLYQEGCSFRKTAEVLNIEGVKTKNYGKALKVRFSEERKTTTGV